MAMSAHLPSVETQRGWDPLAELDRLSALPARADSAAFLAWIVRLRTFTHDDLPAVIGSDPSLFALALSLAGPTFPWSGGSDLDTLLRAIEPSALCDRYEAARDAVPGERRSLERLSRIQLMTALVARELAKEPGVAHRPDPFGCYVLGMIHRLGEVAVLSVVQARGVAQGVALPADACGSPAELAARIGARWGFPPSLLACLTGCAPRGRVQEEASPEVEVVRYAEEIVRGLPSLGRPGAATPATVAGARRPARLRLSKDRLETLVWSAYAEAASLARVLRPWAD